MGNRELFDKKKKYGTLGEEFFDRYVGSILRGFVLMRGAKIERIEGGDLYYIQKGKSITGKGFVEVKTYGNSSIIRFGDKGNVTVPFELSSYEAGTDQTGKEWRPGWGLQILHWDKYNTYAEEKGLKTRAIKPEVLTYLFCESTALNTVNPFVSIAFEVFDQTREKIISAAKEYLNIDLDDWDNIIDKGSELWKGNKWVPDNEWNIPLSKLYDETTTVTMIDNEPSEESITWLDDDTRQKYDEERQNLIVSWRRSRLDKLKEYADKRWFSSTDEERIMQKIEAEIGYKVHRIPSDPSQFTENDDDILELLNEWKEEYEQQQNEDKRIFGHQYLWAYYIG